MEVGELTGSPEMPSVKSPHTCGTADGLAAPLRWIDRTCVEFQGRRLVYFAGCDYLRLSSHPEILESIRAALAGAGLNVAASRRTTGNHELYESLESAAASFFNTPTATLVSSGYQSNLCVAQALAGEVTHAVIDERAHASLHDAARLLGCPLRPFRHRDPASARRAIHRAGPRARVLLITDGLLGHSGETAPLTDYLEVLPRNGWLLVDDAHGAGVLGRHGRGTLEYLGAGPAGGRVIQTATLSKAFGVYGGLVLGSRAVRKRLVAHSGIFIGNTPVPLPLAAGAQRALDLVQSQPTLRRRLLFNSAYVRSALREVGLPMNDGPGPIIPLRPPSPAAGRHLCQALVKAGIHPPFIQYQSGPGSAYFRIAISSEHTPEQLEHFVRTVADNFPRTKGRH